MTARPEGISESELQSLILDRQEAIAWYMKRIRHWDPPNNDWFQDLQTFYTSGTPKHALLEELRGWANDANLAEDSPLPAKWYLFLHYFKEDVNSPLYDPVINTEGDGLFLFRAPFARSFEFATFRGSGPTGAVYQAADRALGRVLDVVAQHGSSLRLGNMMFVRVPFTSSDYSTIGIEDTLKVAWAAGGVWETPPWPPQASPPRRRLFGGSRVPMLIRMRKTASETHVVRMMNLDNPGDLQTLPEWSEQPPPVPRRFEAAIKNWADGTLYLLPMTEQAVSAVSPPAPYGPYVVNFCSIQSPCD